MKEQPVPTQIKESAQPQAFHEEVQDIFDHSKEHPKDDPLVAGTQVNKRQAAQEQEHASEEDDGENEETTKRAIEEQFRTLYEGDPELRAVLAKSDVSTFTIEEKYQIIEAYM